MAKLTENSVVIYSGEITDTSNILHLYADDTWIYYIDKNEWEWRNIGWPEARSDHMMAELDSNLVLLYGGNKFGFYNDSWYYAQDNYYWFEYMNLINRPPLIMGSAISCIGEGFAVMFGGHSDPEERPNSWYDSTWVFNNYARTWIKLDVYPHPSDRLRGRMARIDTNKALLFGGGSQTNIKPEDTWLFVLDSMPSLVDINLQKSQCEISISPNPASDYIEITAPPLEQGEHHSAMFTGGGYGNLRPAGVFQHHRCDILVETISKNTPKLRLEMK